MPRASAAPREAYGTSSQPPRPRLSRTDPPNAFGIGQQQDALGAVDRDVADVLVARLEAGDEVGRRAAAELHRRARMRRRGRREALAAPRPDLDRALERPHRGEARDALDRAEQGDDRGQVVRAHVEQRPGAVGVEDVGVRMPGLLAADEHRRADRERLADGALVDHAATGLVGRAEEDVGRAADAQPEAIGLAGQRRGLGRVGGQGLLGVDVLADRERLHRDRGVHERRRQVEDDVDRWDRRSARRRSRPRGRWPCRAPSACAWSRSAQATIS